MSGFPSNYPYNLPEDHPDRQRELDYQRNSEEQYREYEESLKLHEELRQLQAENTALKAEIANLKSRQITAHGTVEFGGVTWQFYRNDECENDRGHWATYELEPFGVFIWPRNNGFYINADEYGTVKFSSVFDAMQAAIDYAKGEA